MPALLDRISYSFVDTASVRGAALVTNSPPHIGVLFPGDHVAAWYPVSAQQKSTVGIIVGRAQETDGSAVAPKTKALPGVEVRLDRPPSRGDYTARSGRDGTFTIFDVPFGTTGAPLSLTGRTGDGRVAKATAFETGTPRAGVSPKFSRSGEAVLNFGPVAPPVQQSTIAVQIFAKKDDGSPGDPITSGFVAVGQKLEILAAFTDTGDVPSKVSLRVNGLSLEVVKGRDDYHYTAQYEAAEPRSHVVEASAVDVRLRSLFGQTSFLAAIGAADNREPRPEGPVVLSTLLDPRSGTLGIDIFQVFVVQFSEPVKNVTEASVHLLEKGGSAVPILLVGSGPDGVGEPDPETVITSLTVRPKQSLKYGTAYQLVFDETIVDTDDVAFGVTPLPLEPVSFDYTTFQPSEVSAATTEATPLGMTTLGHRVFVALQDDASGSSGSLVAYDISNPQELRKLTEPTTGSDAPRNSTFVGNMVRDLRSGRKVPIGGVERDVVAVLSLNPRSGNSGLTVFDVSKELPRYPYLGLVTTNVPGDGFASGLDLYGKLAYVASGDVGLRIFDLDTAFSLYRAEKPKDGFDIPFSVSKGLFTKGEGFARKAAVKTLAIQVGDEALRASVVDVAETTSGLAGFVGAYGLQKTTGVLATASLGDPGQASILGWVELKKTVSSDTSVEMGVPSGVAFTTNAGGTELAIVVGPGTDSVGRLAIVDVSDLANPILLSLVELGGTTGSALVLGKNGTVLVSTPSGTESYSFADPRDPRRVGTFPGVRIAYGDLALTDGDAVLLSVDRNKELRATALDVVPSVGVRPSPLVTGDLQQIPATGEVRLALQKGSFEVARIPRDFQVDTAEVELLRGTEHYTTLPATITPDGRITFDFEPGFALPMPEPRARAVLNRGTTLERVSAPSVVWFQPLLFGVKERVVVTALLDPVNGTSCLLDAEELTYGLNLSALVTITATAGASERVLFDGKLELESGTSELFIESLEDDLGFLPLVSDVYPYKVTARLETDPTIVVEREGVIQVEMNTGGVLPVGHTYVKGVDLLDGHVVASSTDVRIPGRIPLEITRTYSSHGIFRDGAMGAGWSLNYGSTLLASECFVQVVGGDGTGQRFVRSGERFIPQKGYHTELRANPDGSYDFFTKGRVRYHYEDQTEDGGGFRGRRPTLQFIEDPNGNQLRFGYDELNRLAKVQERSGSGELGRSLELFYKEEPVAGEWRIETITGPLGLVLTYTYDDFGNLRTATRLGEGQNRTERYEYTDAEELLDHHNLTTYTDPNDNVTTYEYYTDEDTFAGETELMPVKRKWEYVRAVHEPQGVTTSFAYDVSEGPSRLWTTRVTDGRGFTTRYKLNGNGSPLEIEEPSVDAGPVLTKMDWAADDIYKTREVDAKGRETLFVYDVNGNLIRETIQAGGAIGDVVTEFRYDPLFNKMTYKKDAEGRESRFQIAGTNGNLLSVTDAEGNVTGFSYRFSTGDLETTVGPRPGQRTSFTYDAYGNPTTTTDALGNVTTSVYDARSRLRSTTDTFGRSMAQDFDQLDRVTRMVRTDGLGSSDEEVVTRTYYPAGQLRTEKNGLGMTTSFTLDGLNRVTQVAQGLVDRTVATTNRYDPNSNVTQKKDRRGVTAIHTYDALNRLETGVVQGPFGAAQVVSRFEYDRVGNKLAETDLMGNRTEYVYDGLYRVTARHLATGHVERFTYDRVGNKLSETDANGHTTTFFYDDLNRLERRRDAVGNVTELDYDGSGNTTREADVTRGLQTLTEYDVLNRPRRRRVVGSSPNAFAYETSFDYDDAVHTVTQTDPRGFRTVTELDAFDRAHRVSQETGDELLETTSFYDGNGNVRLTEDAEGRETAFVYDGLNRLREVQHPLGLTSRFDYDGEGNKTEEINRRNLATRFDYDNLGRLVRTEVEQPITGGGNLTTSQVTYLDSARKRLETDARGHITTFEMDELGRVVKITDPEGFERRFEYDGVNKTAEFDKRGYRTVFEYDAINRLTRVTDALLQSMTTQYLDTNRRVLETDKKNFVKTTQMDALGRLLSVTRSGILLESHAYDGNSNRTLSTDANGNRTQFVYDGVNRLARRTDAVGTPLATTTRFRYDRVGNLLTEKDGRVTGKTFDVRNTYDALNRLDTTEDGEGNVTQFEYDGEGNRTAQIEPEGNRTEFDYGELNELIEVRMADGGVYQYGYDNNRNRTTQTDAEGNVVTFTYDPLNRVDLMIQDPAGFAYVTDHDYDGNGNEIQMTDPKGQVTDYQYDELNRLKKKTYNLTAEDFELYTRTHEITYHYDPNDNLVQIDELKSSGTDPPAVVSSSKSFDSLDRLTSETDAWSRTLGYAYDAQGNRTLLVDPDGKQTIYAYDALNRLETITLDDGQLVRYEYLPNGLKKKVTNPNRTASTYAYDAASRMTDITHTGPTGVVSAYVYEYDDNGNRLQQIETNAGRTETTLYDYDPVNRLRTVTYEAGTASANQVSYTYDKIGNRLTEQAVELATSTLTKDLTYTYDAINRLEQIDSPDDAEDVAYVYDSNGNTLTKAKNGVTTEFLYDIRNQLGEVRQDTNVLGRYGYDSEGLRILKIGDEGRRQYTYDQLSVITEADQANLTVSRYDYGLDQLVRLDNTVEGESFFHLDILGSTVGLTEEGGTTRQSIFYDAWGNERDRIGASSNSFTFTGHEKDEETGLIYAKARFYDPDMGRFLTPDALLGSADLPPSLHRYAYVLLNPLRFVDPNGFQSQATNDFSRSEAVFLVDGQGTTLGVVVVPGRRHETVTVSATRSRSEKILTYTGDLATPLANTMDQATIRGTGVLRTVGGATQVAIGVPLVAAPEPVTTATGVVLIGFGLDNVQAGVRQTFTGQVTETLKGTGIRVSLEGVGMSPENAAWLSFAGEIALDGGSTFAAARMSARSSSTTGVLDDIADDIVDESADVSTPTKLTKEEQIQVNKAAGDAFEAELVEFARQTQDDVQTQVSVRPNTAEGQADFRVRLDSAGRNRTTGELEPLEGKASETAKLTKNQRQGFPLIEQYGGTVVGNAGGETLPAGTEIPAGTKVRIVRPTDLKEP